MTSPEDRSAGALLRDGLALLRAHWMLAIPLVVLGIITGGGRGPERTYSTTSLKPADLLALLPFFALLGLIALIILVVLFFVYVAVWMMTVNGALAIARGGAAPSWGDSWTVIRPRLGQGASASILAVLAVIIGLILLIVPGLIALSGLFPLIAVVLVEGKGGMDALRRTWELTRGERMALFLVILAGVGVNIVAGIVFGWLGFLGGLVIGVIGGLVSAAYALCVALWYHRKTSSSAPAATLPAY